MLNYLETLNTPEWIVLIIVFLIVIVEIIKIISTLWGVIAPKIFKISTNASRKKEIEKIILSNQEEIQKIKEEQLKDREASKKADKDLKEGLSKTDEKLDKINDLVLSMRIENMRKTLLSFASEAGGGNKKHTKEQYEEIFSLFQDYEELLKENGMTNGRVNISMEIIKEKYKHHILHNSFLDSEFLGK